MSIHKDEINQIHMCVHIFRVTGASLFVSSLLLINVSQQGKFLKYGQIFCKIQVQAIFKFLDNKWILLTDFAEENLLPHAKLFTVGLYIWGCIHQFWGMPHGAVFFFYSPRRVYASVFYSCQAKSH